MSSVTTTVTKTGVGTLSIGYRRSQQIMLVLRTLVVLLACAFALFPVVWIFSAAVNPSGAISNQELIPRPVARDVRSTVPGTVVEIPTVLDQYVIQDTVVFVVETADGQLVEYRAPRNGTVQRLNVEVGDEVRPNQVLGVVLGDLDLMRNFRSLFENHPFINWIANSTFIALVTSTMTIFITALAAYSFSRFRFRGRRNLLVSILLVQVFPNMLAIVALYVMLLQIGRVFPVMGLNTYGGLIMVYVGGAMGINIWLMKGFFDSIPRDIDESAMVDGASHWQVYWMLIIPLVRPILVVVAILSFVGVFNEFILARVLLVGVPEEGKTLMLGLWKFVANQFGNDWGVFAAGSLLGALPTLTIYLLLQDQIVGGLTQGSVKG